ncbi:kinase-like domain-containing protein [Halenospora varia]|nr:kinase-like domain-containing protein [Halenospora varia]
MNCFPFGCKWFASLWHSTWVGDENRGLFREDPSFSESPTGSIASESADGLPGLGYGTFGTQILGRRVFGRSASHPETVKTETSDVSRHEIVNWNSSSALKKQPRDHSQDLSSVGGQFSQIPNTDTLNGTADLLSKQDDQLQDQLIDARIEWPEGENQYFIPASDIQRLITLDSISVELKRCKFNFTQTRLLEVLAEKILEVAPRLFAILVHMGKSRDIWEFLKEGLNDKALPLSRCESASEGSVSSRIRLCTAKNPNQPIASMQTWSRHDIGEFDREQWIMYAPIFKASKKVKHYELESNRVMPFIEDRELISQAAGGYGSVWDVRIHPAHQFLYKGTNPEEPNPLMALKRLHSLERKDFDSEVEMLKNFSHNRNPHLVKLLATYRRRGSFYLIFPLAKSNLREYWEETPTPEFSLDTVSWFLQQCKGIASAIVAIHEFRPSKSRKQDASARGEANLSPGSSRTSPEENRLAPNSDVTESERLYGRHGDIKPENILWLTENVSGKKQTCDGKGLLVLADFGLMDFHGKLTKSNINAGTITGSSLYAPPELTLRGNISRAYDVWSLGCVYLEFITWLVCGWEYLNKFLDVRGKTGIDGYICDDTFFTVVNDERGAIVRESVTEWVKDLRENGRCSQFVHDFLDLISNDMLVIDPRYRFNCGQLNEAVAKMNEKAADSAYLTAPKPKDRRIRNEVAKQVDKILRVKRELSSPPIPERGSALPEYQEPQSLNPLSTSARARSVPRLLITPTNAPSNSSASRPRAHSRLEEVARTDKGIARNAESL